MAVDRARYSVLAVERTLRILRSFGSDHTQLNYTEIAELTNIPPSTTYKLLQLLVEEGFLQRGEADGSYRVGTELLRLGKLYLVDTSLVEIAEPWLEKLVARLKFTASLGVLDHDTMVTILTRLGTSPLSLSRDQLLGRRAPLYLSALGKALILDKQEDELKGLLPPLPWPESTSTSLTTVEALVRELKRARECGVTFDNEETSIGMRCVGCPVRDHQGGIVAAISVTATTIEMTDESLPTIMDTVKEIGLEISKDLGYFADDH